MTSPTQRAVADLKKLKYLPAIVERWNQWAKIRQDLFGCIDILALGNDHILALQVCAGASHAARLQKSISEPRLYLWLMAGGKFEVWSYSKKGAAGKRKLWELRRQPVTVEMILEHSQKEKEAAL